MQIIKSSGSVPDEHILIDDNKAQVWSGTKKSCQEKLKELTTNKI